MELIDLYKKKGELITEIEIAQAKLQSVNQEIVKLLNEAQGGFEVNTSKNGHSSLKELIAA